MRETSVVEVNLSAIDRNLRVLRDIVGPTCGLCPIVKADAYGLGAARIARRLAASGADLLAVYSPEQAAALARSAVAAPILVLMPVHDISRTDDLYRALVSGQLHLTLHDEDHLDSLVRIAERFGAVVPLHLEIDTGLSRGGASPSEALELLRRVAATRWLRLAGIFTHFSNARSDPERTAAQLATFDALIARAGAAVPADCVRHVASTYSLLRHPRFHRSMVRFGLAWAGYGLDDLEGGEVITDGQRLEPAITWASRIVQTKTIDAGRSVGYGSLWTAQRRSVIGLVPVGYADGYPLARIRGNGPAMVAVLLDGAGPPDALRRSVGGHVIAGAGCQRRAYVPVVGAVNMDQISIDLTDVVGGGSVGDGIASANEIGVGSRVELVSPDAGAPNHLPRVAAAAGTIPHDMLCRLGPGVRRAYVGETTKMGLDAPTPVAAAG
ncbi:MAG: alanine racemase [Phycisphaerales bacterium]